MEYKQFREYEKKFYQALKVATKARKIKLSAERDIYKKDSPYFYRTFYWLKDVNDGHAIFNIDLSVKYHRFDELQYGIIHPGDDFHFTDKIRANSGAKCYTGFPRMQQEFDCDGSDESIPVLCEDLLNFLEKYYSDFLEMVNKEYGGLDGYYIVNKDKDPRLAGLAYLDKGELEGAIGCFMNMDTGRSGSSWIAHIETEEQLKRAIANGYLSQSQLDKLLVSEFSKKTGREEFKEGYGSIFRERKDQFVDYAVALKNGLEWTSDRAFFGLLPEERGK